MNSLSIINSIRNATMNSMQNRIANTASFAILGNRVGNNRNMIDCNKDLTNYIVCELSICGTDEQPTNDICVR